MEWLKTIPILLCFLLIIPLGESLLLYERTVIHPNSSSAGYYVLNTVVRLDNLTVNDTYAKFSNIISDYRRVYDDTNDVELYADCGDPLELPQISTVKNISFLRMSESGAVGGAPPSPGVVYEDNVTDNVTYEPSPDDMPQEKYLPDFLDWLGTELQKIGDIRVEHIISFFRNDSLIIISAMLSISILSIYGYNKERERKRRRKLREGIRALEHT